LTDWASATAGNKNNNIDQIAARVTARYPGPRGDLHRSLRP
jgi:hypothetical protein